MSGNGRSRRMVSKESLVDEERSDSDSESEREVQSTRQSTQYPLKMPQGIDPLFPDSYNERQVQSTRQSARYPLKIPPGLHQVHPNGNPRARSHRNGKVGRGAKMAIRPMPTERSAQSADLVVEHNDDAIVDAIHQSTERIVAAVQAMTMAMVSTNQVQYQLLLDQIRQIRALIETMLGGVNGGHGGGGPKDNGTNAQQAKQSGESN